MQSTREPAIRVNSLRKTYGSVVAVDDVSFEVERGSLFCIIGPNGAGKTTTVECMEGLRQPDSGSVLVAGLDPVGDHDAFVRKIGVQLQDIGIPPRMKAGEALRLFSSLYPSPAPVSELGEELGLGELLRKRYGSLSGGEKRRVNIALALIGDPEIVFLDEPTTGLDPESRFRFWEYMSRKNARGMTIVATTHYLEEAGERSDTVLLMSGGRVVSSGRPGKLISESGLTTRLTLPRRTLGATGANDLESVRGIARVRTSETNFYIYGDDDMIGSVSDFLRQRGISPVILEARPVNLEDLYFLAVGQEEKGDAPQ